MFVIQVERRLTDNTACWQEGQQVSFRVNGVNSAEITLDNVQANHVRLTPQVPLAVQVSQLATQVSNHHDMSGLILLATVLLVMFSMFLLRPSK